MNIKIGLVDDHQLFLKSLSSLLSSIPGIAMVVEATHGKDLQQKIEEGSPLPDIMLIDVEMPVMNGVATARWLHATHPSVRLVALSMKDNEQTVIDMIKAGCCSFLLKDTHPDELELALHEVYSKNYYNTDINKVSLTELLLNNQFGMTSSTSENERTFLQHATSDLTYKQIALLMELSERTIDGYRESLFSKFKVQSRTGMVLEGIRRGLVKI